MHAAAASLYIPKDASDESTASHLGSELVLANARQPPAHSAVGFGPVHRSPDGGLLIADSTTPPFTDPEISIMVYRNTFGRTPECWAARLNAALVVVPGNRGHEEWLRGAGLAAARHRDDQALRSATTDSLVECCNQADATQRREERLFVAGRDAARHGWTAGNLGRQEYRARRQAAKRPAGYPQVGPSFVDDRDADDSFRSVGFKLRLDGTEERPHVFGGVDGERAATIVRPDDRRQLRSCTLQHE